MTRRDLHRLRQEISSVNKQISCEYEALKSWSHELEDEIQKKLGAIGYEI